jgi:hypothetical protein
VFIFNQIHFVTVTVAFAMEIIEKTKRKKPNHLPESVIFNSNEEGHCIQIMDIGSYDDEPASFRKTVLRFKIILP